ncbi:MAG: NAD-dependent epimerase/dehydratase family protein, partial [Petrotogales bacterium]
MRVLVTGHRGYIGTVLIPMLAEEGYEIIGLDSDLYKECTFGERKKIKKIPEINKDIRNIRAFDIDGFEAIIHLAGFSNDPLGDLNPKLTLEINYEASVRLARMAKEAGVKRFIFSSSCSNYGAAGQDWVKEESKLNPVTPYG